MHIPTSLICNSLDPNKSLQLAGKEVTGKEYINWFNYKNGLSFLCILPEAWSGKDSYIPLKTCTDRQLMFLHPVNICLSAVFVGFYHFHCYHMIDLIK